MDSPLQSTTRRDPQSSGKSMAFGPRALHSLLQGWDLSTQTELSQYITVWR